MASLTTTAGLAAWIANGEGAFDTAPADDVAVPDPTDPDASVAEATTAETTSPETTVPDTTVAEVTTPETTVPDTTVAEVITPETTTPAATTTEETVDDGERIVTVAFADGTYVGSAEYTEWGDVQVEVTIEGGELVDVVTVQIPSGRRSTPINERAVPLLEAAAVASQTADLDIVTGATYTSVTYAVSLQAALDEAALAAMSAGVVSEGITA